jgi:outer membrane protein TolC
MRTKFFILAIAAQMLVGAAIALGGEIGTSTSSTSATFSASSTLDSRIFTLDAAVLTALQQNPDVLRARQEIQRTKGFLIEVVAQAVPRLAATGAYSEVDPNLNISRGGLTGGFSGSFSSDISYNLRLQVTQRVFAGGSVIASIRAADFQRDVSYYQLRNTIDQVIATVRQQFYQVVLNKALIGVQEESVRLLESQLKDQQNRFEAGTVPRFNVLQAEVALANQQPSLIAARNNYRISQLTLSRTLGLNFDPRHQQHPLECKGELVYVPREIPLEVAIELGKEQRPFLKQQQAAIMNQIQQVRIAFAGFLPVIDLNGGYLFRSSVFSEKLRDISDGHFVGATGTWNVFDGGVAYGRVKQTRAVLQQARITFADAVRQVELEVQTSFANLQKDRETIQSQEKNVEQAKEAFRLASARLGAGAGTQLDVLNAQVALTQASSTLLQALYSYNADLAEFDRVTATQTIYSEIIDVTGKRRSTTTTTTTTTKKATKKTSPTPAPTASPRRTR